MYVLEKSLITGSDTILLVFIFCSVFSFSSINVDLALSQYMVNLLPLQHLDISFKVYFQSV